jgi:hypothetical protein
MLWVDDESTVASPAGFGFNFGALLLDDPIRGLDDTLDPIVELPELRCPNPLEVLPRPPACEPDERPKPLPCDDRPVPLDEPMRGNVCGPLIPFVPLLWL